MIKEKLSSHTQAVSWGGKPVGKKDWVGTGIVVAGSATLVEIFLSEGTPEIRFEGVGISYLTM